jgi:hypothetical protein
LSTTWFCYLVHAVPSLAEEVLRKHDIGITVVLTPSMCLVSYVQV